MDTRQTTNPLLVVEAAIRDVDDRGKFYIGSNVLLHQLKGFRELLVAQERCKRRKIPRSALPPYHTITNTLCICIASFQREVQASRGRTPQQMFGLLNMLSSVLQMLGVRSDNASGRGGPSRWDSPNARPRRQAFDRVESVTFDGDTRQKRRHRDWEDSVIRLEAEPETATVRRFGHGEAENSPEERAQDGEPAVVVARCPESKPRGEQEEAQVGGLHGRDAQRW